MGNSEQNITKSVAGGTSQTPFSGEHGGGSITVEVRWLKRLSALLFLSVILQLITAIFVFFQNK